MNTKFLLPLIVVIALVAGGAWWLSTNPSPTSAPLGGEQIAPENAAEVTDGTYTVIAAESEVQWAGKKPLIEGYINTGAIAVTEGTITRNGNDVSGTFTIDMDTLSVSATPTKPGSENALEGHLKGERWFNVAMYPTATFVITNVVPSTGVQTYTVTGDLTMKGQTHEVSFPATIYQDAEGRVHASAAFEIDRTLWGITSGSASFFDNLADNAIDDMVALSFTLVAE